MTDAAASRRGARTRRWDVKCKYYVKARPGQTGAAGVGPRATVASLRSDLPRSPARLGMWGPGMRAGGVQYLLLGTYLGSSLGARASYVHLGTEDKLFAPRMPVLVFREKG